MRRPYLIVLTAAAAVGVCIPAFADTQSPAATNVPTSIIVHSVTGKSTVLPINARKASELLSNPHTKPLPGDIVVFVVNGKAYMLEDHRLPNGKMFVSNWMAEYPTYDAPDGGD